MSYTTAKTYKPKRPSDTLCWDCKKALCGCSWSMFFEPVEGWKARKTPKTKSKPSSYKVYKCPEFVSDKEDGDIT